jgi:phage terminase small subunit
MGGAKHQQNGMTVRQAAFAREYAKDLNGAQAAIRAGFSARSARRLATRMIKNPVVVAEVHRRLKRLSVQADVTVDKVLRSLALVAYGDLSSVIRIENGRVVVVDTDALSPDQRAPLAEISSTDSGVRVKLHDKVKALELLGKYLAMFTDRHEVTGEDGGPLVVVQPACPPLS